MAGLRQAEIREKVQTYFKEQLSQYDDWLDRRVLSRNALDHVREEIQDHESFLGLDSAHTQWLPVARFKRKMAVSDAEWDSSLPRIAIELRKGRRDMLRAVLEAAESRERYSYAQTPAAHPAPSPVASAPLGRAIEDFMDEHSRQWPQKTSKQFRAYLNILIEYFGEDRLLGTITKQDASEVKKVLQALPSSRKTKPALKDLPITEVIKVRGHSTITPKTINSHIDAFRRFFDWAERHAHAPHRLFEGMKVPKAKDGVTERKPYTKEQTSLIFSVLTRNPSGLVRSDSHRWGTLLGMFTGARLNEICQLEIADIKQDGDIWFLDITDEGDDTKRLKAKASKRKVPIHSGLIQLGFLDFVKSREKQQRLFHDYSYNRNGGYGRNLGRWYNESFLPKLGIKEPALVFHSLRHTMITRLAQAGVPEPIIQSIVGHARAGVTQEVYMREGYTLHQLHQAIEKFQL
ncbi:site-specific integrase [Alkalilacustris brevis]|uniref:site-specific integrase n=1 Tax=Alkalilacustris brevis TaxID=2026338 RepID=UPI001EE3C3C1|nr:site-specific integrase [Alkalilacustris brevis]